VETVARGAAAAVQPSPDHKELAMTALLDGNPDRRPGDDDEDWLALIALAALTLTALVAFRRLTGRMPR
jgi:hypothetical protein